MYSFLFFNVQIFTAIYLKGKAFFVLLFLAIVVSGCTQQQQAGNTTITGTGNVKEFNVQLSQFKFEPGTITVKKGDTVKLNLTSIDVPHGFSLPEFGASAAPQVGQTETVQFVADKTGTFTFRCSVLCGSGHATMSGTLVVEE